MYGNSLGISIKQHTKQYSKGEQLSPSAFAISRIPTCQKVSLWTKTEGLFGFLGLKSIPLSPLHLCPDLLVLKARLDIGKNVIDF